MTTKPQNLLRSLLLIPYLTWGIALLFVYLVSGPAGNLYTSNAFFDALMGVTSFYTIGILLWGIPYTILAVGLFLWSINKPAPTIYKVFAFSPFVLSILMVIEILLISFWPLQAQTSEVSMDLSTPILVAIIPTIIYGYGFVGAGSLLYKVARRLTFISIEGEAK
ncbi:MAG: hypothetical protein JW963_12135 [Anaerolineales bacterium]|nr:hypothetical protein [Anaerolineales bacterium]